MTRVVLTTLTLSLVTARMAGAQAPLSLADAMQRARTQHPAAKAATAAQREAVERVSEARSGYFPRVDFIEGWQRGDQPVFVFSSLLSQRRFTEANFAIDTLNHPDAVNNFRSAFTVEQPIFDGGLTRLGVRAANLGHDIAEAGKVRVEQDLAFAAAQAYARTAQLQAAERATQSAVEAAQSDLARARERRDAGLVTEADVLAVEVQLAQARQLLVQTRGDLLVARAALSEAIGAPLDEQFVVTLPPAEAPAESIEVLEKEAIEKRADILEATFGASLAANAVATARAAYLPQVGFQGGYEWNGGTFGSQVSSWVVGAQVRLNVFRGLGDRARLAAAQQALARRSAEREALERSVRLEVRSALTRFETAQAREDVGRAAVSQAQETQRILRDRYETGLVTVTDVLRAAQAVQQAESQAIAARVDVVLQRLALDRALGRL